MPTAQYTLISKRSFIKKLCTASLLASSPLLLTACARKAPPIRPKK